MNERKHTPGPWNYDAMNGQRLGVWSAKTGQLVATVNKGRADDATLAREDHIEANARLIAAAPDLLAACELALGVVTVLNRNLTEGGTIRILEHAINKAKGE